MNMVITQKLPILHMTDTKHKFPILKEKSSEVEIQNFEVEIF